MRRRDLMLAGLAGLAAGIPKVRADEAPAQAAPAAEGEGAPLRTYGLSLVGTPRLPEGFPYFPYVNPNAPKGGAVALADLGSFDSFNPFIVRGTAPQSIGRVWDTLLRETADELDTGYAHLAAVIEIAADHSYVAFELRPEARFHDGKAVTAEDVVWTFEALRTKGRPYYRQYYAGVDKAVAEGERRVVFHFKRNDNRELPMILGELVVLPKHWWEGRDFSAPLTDPPLGSGPYRVGAYEFGRTLTLQRVPEYWGRDLPTAKGQDNFGSIRTEYFRDSTVALQAFKAGQVDYRRENISKVWATEYEFPAVKKGLVRKQAFPSSLPTGMQCFVMNTRRPVFADRRVREAMTQVFDFQWENKNLFYGLYTRTTSFFSNSGCASSGLPGPEELRLLEPYRDKLPPEVFTKDFTLPVTDGSGNNREGMTRALKLMESAGYHVKSRKMIGPDGNQMAFDILLDEPVFERVTLPYVQWLDHLGIRVNVRTVDPAEYQHLTDAFDFDMTINTYGESDSPGNELVDFWGSAAAKQEGSDNLAGVSDPVVDALIAKVVGARTRDDLVTAARALDRVLLWGWYVVPQWHIQSVWVAWWDRFGHPDVKVRSGVAFNTWWVDEELAEKTDAARRSGL
ncbi:MAG TPA: extracellular solute-binding protein [Acetobacteraceae bacterium]|nr:extracellular solute-binding protein [Acetobacteraceae bacterium]